MAQVREVTASYGVGGKIQVVDFKINSEYHFGASEVIALAPADDPDEVRDAAVAKLKEALDPLAQAEFEDLMDQREAMQKKKQKK